jgi:hypothetical protein
MSDCEHVYTLESIENPEGGKAGTRTIWLICTICAHRQSRLTQRTDAEIEAALAEIETP